MQVTLDIPDEIAAQAKAVGQTTEKYVQKLLESSLRPVQVRKVMTEEELEEFIQNMSQYSDQIPILPKEAFSRESIYSDHD